MENKSNKLLLESIDRDIEIILDNQVKIKLYFDSHVRGFYVYKDLWSSLIDEKGFKCFHEKEKETYKSAITVYRNDLCWRIIVRYVPMNMSKLLVKFYNYQIHSSLARLLGSE